MTRAGVAMRMSDADLRAAISRRREQLMRLSGRARRADIERVGEWLRVLVAEKERRGRVEVRAFLQMRIDAPEHCSEADALALFHLAGSEYEQLGERCLRWLKFTNLARMAAPGSNVAELEYQMYRAQWCWLIAKAASTVQQHENATVQQHEYAEDWL